MSSSLAPAFRFMLGDEGGYANIPGDSGKETYEGVSRANWPHWAGWQIIDKAKQDLSLPEDGGFSRDQVQHLNATLAAIPELQNLVQSFYSQMFWLPLFGYIEYQSIASKVFDESVNMGLPHGIMCLQDAIAKAGTPCIADGKFGQQTLDAANGYPESVLMPFFVESIKERYQEIVKYTPSDAKFLPIWNRRAERMPAEFGKGAAA